MAAAYINVTSVKAKLPASLPTALTDARILILIQEASAEIDEAVGSRYAYQFNSDTQKFPDYGSTPDTPGTIKKIALWLTLSACYEEIGESNRGNEKGAKETNKAYYRRLAEGKLEKILNGVIELNLGTENSASSVFEGYEKYPSDETSMDRKFTNDAMDSLY